MIGRTISHYKILSRRGEGGVGVVHKAEDTKLDRPVALNLLAARVPNDEDINDRIRREAERGQYRAPPGDSTLE